MREVWQLKLVRESGQFKLDELTIRKLKASVRGTVIVGVDPDPGKRDILAAWAKEYWEYFFCKPEHHPFLEILFSDLNN